jgi:hypothetical protein
VYKILEAVVGSQAYGLATETSDKDILGVFLEPTANIVSLDWNKYKESHTHTDPDWTYHEVGKFLSLVLKGNPSVTELLFMKEYTILEPVAEAFVQNSFSFLSANAIFASYGGYARAQIKRYESHTGRYGNEAAAKKNARHTFRLLVQGCQLLSSGKMSVQLSEQHQATAWKISDLCISDPDAFFSFFEQWDAELSLSMKNTVLPEEPDRELINTLLKDLRYDYFWGVP